jgi:hypothetical protein
MKADISSAAGEGIAERQPNGSVARPFGRRHDNEREAKLTYLTDRFAGCASDSTL